MLYRIVRSLHRRYALTVFWLYVGLFLVAFCFVFMFPPATLALLFLGIFGLVVVTVVEFLLGAAEHSMARRWLARDACPLCHDALDVGEPGSRRPRACVRCGSAFESDGSEVEDDQLVSAVGPS